MYNYDAKQKKKNNSKAPPITTIHITYLRGKFNTFDSIQAAKIPYCAPALDGVRMIHKIHSIYLTNLSLCMFLFYEDPTKIYTASNSID